MVWANAPPPLLFTCLAPLTPPCRRIKLDNATVRSKVAALPGSLELLQLAGFSMRDG